MTIAVELLNQDSHRSVEVLYSDTVFGTDGQPIDAKLESFAKLIAPGEKYIFYLTSQRDLRVLETIDHPIDKSEPVDS